ncbi:MerR family transcriptional regulator [Litorivicinus lipolyticus]|uniref:MerR family transcriptional regulator n=1 Tax=Litorivicinus lipolyticus TaxID=418701 RepID=UPI003B5B59CA
MTTANARHPIRVVSLYTGLSPELIRAWEKRYQAVEPTRTDTGRRLYSDKDVDRLKLLKRASDNGRRISDIAGYSSQELTELISQDQPMVAAVEAAKQPDGSEVEALRASMMDAIREHNPAALDALLYRGSLQFTSPTLMEDVVAPLLRSIGEGTREGSLRISHEHMATAQIRTFLGAMRPASVEYQEAPRVIITTPSGQLHELGALMVSVTCASEGWMPIYLGPNTPADEIAVAAVASGAMAVGLSITYPADDPRLPGELRRLRRQLPDNIPIFIGGAAVRENSPLLQELHSPYLNSLHAVRDYLAELRQGIEGY